MQETNDNLGNLLLNRLSPGPSISEFVPDVELSSEDKSLSWDSSGNIRWKAQATPQSLLSFIADVQEVHFDQTRIGIGRKPLHSYKIDLSVPVNTRMTAFHVGDGTFGFSLGNGTTQGFVPEIVGMGSDEEDAGLYLLGKTSSSLPSNVPLIVLDGRNIDNTPLKNRPILGITNGDYFNYKVIVDNEGNVGIGRTPEIYKLEVDGIIRAKDVMTDSSVSLESLKAEVDYLRTQLQLLKEK